MDGKVVPTQLVKIRRSRDLMKIGASLRVGCNVEDRINRKWEQRERNLT